MVLTAKPSLNGYSKDFKTSSGNVSLSEITGKALVSLATPVGHEKKLAIALKKSFRTTLPQVGTSNASKDGGSIVLGLQSDQVFMLFDYDGIAPTSHIAEKLGNAGYYTDQSDSWVIIKIAGTGARTALERICMIDLHPTAFPAGSVARTMMEHLGTIIYHQLDGSFLIMSARSSAKSLLHALEVSIHNIT